MSIWITACPCRFSRCNVYSPGRGMLMGGRLLGGVILSAPPSPFSCKPKPALEKIFKEKREKACLGDHAKVSRCQASRLLLLFFCRLWSSSQGPVSRPMFHPGQRSRGQTYYPFRSLSGCCTGHFCFDHAGA